MDVQLGKSCFHLVKCINSLVNYLIECSLQVIIIIGCFVFFLCNGTVMMSLMWMCRS